MKNKYINLSIEELEDLLASTLKTFDVPEHRRRDASWVLRNVAIRNSNHPDYNKVIEISKAIIKL